ncbi:MAG: cytochrome P460 family protein [Rhodospirillales bacterium]|nr:cytochrome P460 family protein [Rhodospirillales bacterium]
MGVLSLALMLGSTPGQAAEPPFGGPGSIAFAKTLWTALENANWVGKEQIRSKPYLGTEPHGFVLESLDGQLEVSGRTGWVVVKRNYGPKGVKIDAVEANRSKHLAAITVMFKREKGYDPDNQDWFWAKYKADGSIDKDPKGANLVGRVAKGMDAGCIACHKGAPGGDMVFVFDPKK